MRQRHYSRVVGLFVLAGIVQGNGTAFTTCIDSNAIVGDVRGIVVFEYKGREWIVPGAAVAILDEAAASSLVAETKADDAARFSISGIKPGKYRLNVGSPGLLSAHADIEIRPRLFIVGPRNRRVLKVVLGLVLGPCPRVQSVPMAELSANH